MPNDDHKVVIRVDKQPTGTYEPRFNAPTIDEVATLIVDENVETHGMCLHVENECMNMRKMQ